MAQVPLSGHDAQEEKNGNNKGKYDESKPKSMWESNFVFGNQTQLKGKEQVNNSGLQLWGGSMFGMNKDSGSVPSSETSWKQSLQKENKLNQMKNYHYDTMVQSGNNNNNNDFQNQCEILGMSFVKKQDGFDYYSIYNLKDPSAAFKCTKDDFVCVKFPSLPEIYCNLLSLPDLMEKQGKKIVNYDAYFGIANEGSTK